MSSAGDAPAAAALPRHLGDRARTLRQAAAGRGSYLLYLLDGNLRTVENQALDAALTLANAHGRPLVVLAELRADQPWASDRHHRFQLEGLRDLQQALDALGVRCVVHVERPGQDADAAALLAREATVTVVDDIPTRPHRARRARLLETLDAAAGGPLIAVDASCLVPMRLVGRAYDRAFKFRTATRDLRRARLETAVPPVRPAQPRYADALPVAGCDLTAWDLGELTAACPVDHSVPPVPEFPGGEAAAATHWADWRDSRLAGYAARRNDPLEETAVSRLSPYLHHGMIAATRLAREAAATGGKGAEKFLDELLIWREMSWSYAFHEPDHDTTAVLPGWARETLAQRTRDPRPALYTWEELARGDTDDPLWNAAQHAYLRRGYLHNNLRMTWGKALLNWTEGPERCAELLVDLNNRYSLDGSDPNSYQGLFWCLGAFDRPFAPAQPIFGTVRHRATAVHAERLDVAAYAARQVRAPADELPRVAVVGAGLAGLICARTLADHGVPVTVFDKGRRPGGRTAAKRLDDGRHGDHGAPKLELDDPRLAPVVQAWRAAGVLADWTPAGMPPGPEAAWTVARPSTRGLAEHLARDLDLESGVAVDRLERGAEGWSLATADGLAGPFDRVVVAAPAAQAADLLAPVAPALAATARQAGYRATMSALAMFDRPLALDADVLAPADDPALGLAVRDSAKPGRAAGAEVWALHAGPSWSQAHRDDDFDAIAQALVAAFRARTGAPAPQAAIGHRWRYAVVLDPLGRDYLLDPDRGIGACGDWCLGPTAGDALRSGIALAGRLFALEPRLATRGRPGPPRPAAA